MSLKIQEGRNYTLPSLMRFLRPSVPSLSHIDSSLSVFATTGRGDFGLIVAIFPLLSSVNKC